MASRVDRDEIGRSQAGSAGADFTPLVAEGLKKRRSVFAPHKRRWVSSAPVFLNLFLPWGVFVFCMGITTTKLMYSSPGLVYCILAMLLLCWVILVFLAIWARTYAPDPTWCSHLALSVGVAGIIGYQVGMFNFEEYVRKYYAIKDWKTADDIDAMVTPGSSLADVGIIHFRPGSALLPHLSWQFESGSLYCVAPIVTNANASHPLFQQYDYWAVGKDCCSTDASDFRCGSWGHIGPKVGIRVVEGGDADRFRLAVQQAESLYGIKAPRPILLQWSADPALEVASWASTASQNFLFYTGVAFIVSLFTTSMSSVRFSRLGRGRGDSDDQSQSSQQFGYLKAADYGAQFYSVA